jgi:hypothetical protein
VRSFYELINSTISYSLNQFYTKQYVSAYVLSSELLQPQIQASIDQFKTSTTNTFLLSLIKIRDTTHVNALFSAQMTNYQPILLDTTGDLLYNTNKYSNCSCDVSPRCISQSYIYDYINNTVLFTVPGMHVGCYIIESSLQSTFECFYNRTCVNQLI